MNIAALFTTQHTLNKRIIHEHQLESKDLFSEQLLAFLVELGELANETRCFKYWSKKPSSEKEVILEEYVDGLHFILTMGIALDFMNFEPGRTIEQEETLTKQFTRVMERTHQLHQERSETSYIQLFQDFLMLGQMLELSEEEIERGYYEKNQVNHKRQDEGY
ncbi:dUTP diphosphatase [Halalkalibacter urbisdiaboli]|uniref:dUTP diphosphatase n=1 Tax=Halalkalibacter urbisdiaboli TaxID=1960589 RepID=UPI000B434923|nr:dUTP diphosphatase [Halalkalibacter urbisdiaboli]